MRLGKSRFYECLRSFKTLKIGKSLLVEKGSIFRWMPKADLMRQEIARQQDWNEAVEKSARISGKIGGVRHFYEREIEAVIFLTYWLPIDNVISTSAVVDEFVEMLLRAPSLPFFFRIGWGSSRRSRFLIPTEQTRLLFFRYPSCLMPDFENIHNSAFFFAYMPLSRFISVTYFK